MPFAFLLAAFLPFDTLTCEVTGCAWGCGANTDPTFVNPTLVATLRGANGHVEDFALADVCWEGAFLVNRRFSAAERARFGGKAEVADVRLTGGDPARNAAIRVGEARLFTEGLSPLKIDVTPRERLPFPARADTVVPATPDPQGGDLLADWKVTLPEGCTVVRTRKGKSLVIDVTAPAGAVTEIPTGVACEARKVKDFPVPFLTWGERAGRIKADLLEGGWYRLAFFDWTVSNASDVFARETPGGRELVARYKPKTDGSRNPVRERIVVTLSRNFDEILPEIPNPKSPYKRLTGTHVWRAHASFDRADDTALWRKVRASGLAHVAVTDHETMWRDHGEPFTFCTVAAPGKGGDAAQRAYARTLIGELGYLYGPYNNFTDLSTQSDFFSRDAVARREDGSFQPAWMRCYGPKPVLMPAACDRFAGELKRKFGFNAGYCDVHTSMLPWQRTDYDSRVPGAATYAQTFYSWGETLLKQKEIWQGPVYSEGSHQFLWAGLADGSYGQDRGYDFRNEPWIVDFELRRTQRLCTDFGMGSLSMFSPPQTDLDRMYYLPGQPKGRDELVNRFLAATVAFGHSGYLILDGCWEPAKPFGPAYGVPCKPVWKEKGLPAEALRSYFMIQALAARYTQSEAEEILYADADGRLRTASAAIADGSVARNQVVTRYADGTVTAVNGSDSLPMKARAFGRKIDLSPNGFAGWADGVTVLSTDVEGRRRHFADGPEYTYVEDEGKPPVVHLKSRYVFPRSYGRLTGFAFGNGHYVKNPGAFSINANGHNNATSYNGFEFANGKSVVVGAAAPITRVWWDPKTGEAGVACDAGAPFRFVESTNGLFAAAFDYRRRYPRRAAAGVKAKAGKFCVDVWNGTYRQQAEFVRRAASELKITNDIFLCTHVWQRHGYDNGLPEVWPPDPAFGTVEDMKALARTCRENGWGFGVHHNVVDFYTNATCFAWSDIARNERQEPMYAWRNVFRKTQSWRMAPEVAASYMRRSLDEMNAVGFSPDMLFVDVIGSFPAKPYFTAQGRWVGPDETRRQIGDVFETIRAVQSAATGRTAFTASEAAHDYLVGRLDGGDCQWMEVTREPGEYCWNVIPEYEDMEKIPWFDAVNHAVFALHGAGYSIRYEAGRGELDHGIDSDDYLNAEILSGHALMTDCYSRDVRDVLSGTVRPLDMERCLNQLKRKWTLAQPVARELAGAEMTGHAFVGGDIHRQKVTWSTGLTVYANRGMTDWTVEGVTLPPYGFLAVNPKTGVRAEISRERPRPRAYPKRFLDVTPEEIVRNPRGYQLHFWLAKRKPTENSWDYYDRLLTARDETPADAPKGEKLDRLVTVTDLGADPYDVTARYYLNGVPSFDRRFYLKETDAAARTEEDSGLTGVHGYTPKGYVPVTEPAVRENIERFRDLKLGLMMHFGIYSQAGIIESWPLNDQAITWARPMTDMGSGDTFKRNYWNLNRSFNPVRYDPARWARVAATNGFRYLCFTAKHHDGFCLWDTAYTDYKVTAPDCPYSAQPKPDLLRATYDAFRKEGLKISLYFSKGDWHHPDYWDNLGYGKEMTWFPSYDPEAHPERWRRFKDFTWNQVLELVRDYGRFEVLWLDCAAVGSRKATSIDIDGLVAACRRIQPWLIAADRTCGGKSENLLTPEQCVPPEPMLCPWESCVTMASNWSYRYDDEYKSATELIHLLIGIVAKGGCLVLNVAPRPDGGIPEPALARMDAMGAWLRANGEAIYGTRPVAPYMTENWAYTQRDGRLYALRMRRPGERDVQQVVLPPNAAARRIVRVVHLPTGRAFPFEKTRDGWRVTYPADVAADPHADAFCLELEQVESSERNAGK